VKVYGQNLDTINALSQQFKNTLTGLEGVHDLYVEPITGGKYVEVSVKKEEVGRYGLSVDDVNMVVESSIGGMNITNTVEGRQRFSVNARFAQDYRRNIEQLKRLLVTTPVGPVPLSAVADITITEGPPMINSENAMLRGTLLFNVRERDMGSTVNDAKKRLDSLVKKLPKGYFIEWSGQYENQVRAEGRLKILIPVVLIIIAVILYFTFHTFREVLIVLTSIPVALVGGAYSLFFFDVNFSVAVAVGFIALFGVAVETGVLMLVYLNNSLHNQVSRRQAAGEAVTNRDIEQACMRGLYCACDQSS
jgi:Cu(I)/Ag(I) efflux system membrane protein CusA/SilA